MNSVKINTVDSLLKLLVEQKKNFISNLEVLNEDLLQFTSGQISGLQYSIDILLDKRIEYQEELNRLSLN